MQDLMVIPRMGAAQEAIACVLVKRTWTLDPADRWAPAPTQETLVMDPRTLGGESDPTTSLVRWDSDLFCVDKPGVDLVVQGDAFAREGTATVMEVSVSVPAAGFARRVLVHGDRVATAEGDRVRFSPPRPFSRMPVRYDRAYGGVDALEGDALFQDLLDVPAGIEYPRNPAGVGYLIAPRALGEGVALPNLEDPEDRLTPARLFTEDAMRWNRAPIPAAFDWCDVTWFPRALALGMPALADDPPSRFIEAQRGWVDHAALDVDAPPLCPERATPMRFSGASPGMLLAALRPRDEVVVRGMHPFRATARYALPAERPVVTLREGNGAAHALEPALRTVALRPERDELVTVYAATCALRDAASLVSKERLARSVRWTR